MIRRVVRLGQRVIHLGIAVVGVVMAQGGYPPPPSGPPVLLFVGGIMTIIGLVGILWPGKVRTGGGGDPD
jgi:hypothetical protein